MITENENNEKLIMRHTLNIDIMTNGRLCSAVDNFKQGYVQNVTNCKRPPIVDVDVLKSDFVTERQVLC